MDKVRAIIQRKPRLFMVISLVYLVAVGLLKWQLRPPWTALLYLAGGLLGIYFLDVAEEFFHLVPSPFRSIIFEALFVVVGLFVVTSSGSLLASGLVLSLYLSLILWQAGEWQVVGNLNQWYRMLAQPVAARTQFWLLITFIILFIVETLLFLR